MTDEELEEYHASEDREWTELCEEIAKKQAEFKEKWPNYCRTCGGWGGHIFYQSHPYGMSSAQERMCDPCDAAPTLSTCHRCWCEGLDADTSDGPCKFCGWNYDDGVPE